MKGGVSKEFSLPAVKKKDVEEEGKKKKKANA